ncbi:hypothetical protein [Fuerstiella marisgermanici]|nr:hypothetical protein [Fuerstiella marisgermanici]
MFSNTEFFDEQFLLPVRTGGRLAWLTGDGVTAESPAVLPLVADSDGV